MLRFKKRLVTIIFLSLFSAAIIVSCGKQGNSEEATTEEAADHPEGEHPADSTDHPEGEHPADSTQNNM